jgi:hypothetical protein
VTSSLRRWYRAWREVPSRPVSAWRFARYHKAELALYETCGEVYPMVCVEHMRFIPCRWGDGCILSDQTEDVEMVRERQREGA